MKNSLFKFCWSILLAFSLYHSVGFQFHKIYLIKYEWVLLQIFTVIKEKKQSLPSFKCFILFSNCFTLSNHCPLVIVLKLTALSSSHITCTKCLYARHCELYHWTPGNLWQWPSWMFWIRISNVLHLLFKLWCPDTSLQVTHPH